MTRCAPNQRGLERRTLRMIPVLLEWPVELSMAINHDDNSKRNPWWDYNMIPI